MMTAETHGYQPHEPNLPHDRSVDSTFDDDLLILEARKNFENILTPVLIEANEYFQNRKSQGDNIVPSNDITKSTKDIQGKKRNQNKQNFLFSKNLTNQIIYTAAKNAQKFLKQNKNPTLEILKSERDKFLNIKNRCNGTIQCGVIEKLIFDEFKLSSLKENDFELKQRWILAFEQKLKESDTLKKELLKAAGWGEEDLEEGLEIWKENETENNLNQNEIDVNTQNTKQNTIDLNKTDAALVELNATNNMLSGPKVWNCRNHPQQSEEIARLKEDFDRQFEGQDSLG